MSNRILVLADQYNLEIDPAYPSHNRKVLEKLIEAIVKESADFIQPLGDWCGGHGEPSAPTPSECSKRLKQHFGVE